MDYRGFMIRPELKEYLAYGDMHAIFGDYGMSLIVDTRIVYSAVPLAANGKKDKTGHS
jgi:hypothetical protein